MYFVEIEIKCAEFLGYPVYDLAYALNDQDGYDQIILCDFDKKKYKNILTSKGLQYGTDFIYEEDFFETLDEVHIPKNRKIAVWGTGLTAKKLANYNIEWNTDCYIDTYKRNEQFNGIKVVTPDSITDWKTYFIIIAVEKDQEIRDVMINKGLMEKKDFISYQYAMGMPSDLLRRTIFDKSYYDLECRTMLNHLEILYRGNTRCCCTTFVEQNLDNIMDKGVNELWHSNLHKILCLSTENHTYSFCDKTMCPLFVAKKNENLRNFESAYKQMSDFPETLALGYDATCNLNCITCRSSIFVANAKERAELSVISDRVIKDYLTHCKFLILAGDGEVFLSSAYKEIYLNKKCNPRYIRLLSNGLLFNQTNWEKFIDNKTGYIMLTVSIDAATKETYEKIRRSGNFDILKQNMQFASKLRKAGQLKYFRMNFVVQKENYKEMPMFVKWGEELGVDEIFFSKLLNWGTYSDEEFVQISMMEQDGVTPKYELQQIMQLPDMKSDIVDMGTIQFGHKIDEIHVVENYYMWELEKRGGKIFG